jgi:Na+-transporting NADH:ubiquinone oxidoreductase subunit B
VQFLRELIDKQQKLYKDPASKLHKVWPFIESIETFLFAPGTKTPDKGPHVRDYIDLKRTMWIVIVALIPCVLFTIYNTGYQHFEAIKKVGMADDAYQTGWLQDVCSWFGYGLALDGIDFWDRVVFGLDQMIPLIVVSYVVGLGIEVMFSVWRSEEVSEGYLVSGILIALVVPPSIPLWQLALAVAFTVILVKEVFGGTGQNIFNPAMMARAFLFFAYAAQMSGQKVWVAGNGAQNLIDGYSGATPLAVAAGAKLSSAATAAEAQEKGWSLVSDATEALHTQGYGWWDMFWGLIPGSAGETSFFCCLLGALVLVVTGIGSWRTMLSGVIGLLVACGIMMWGGGMEHGLFSLPPHYHLVMGGFAFGLVFMATDPVSSPETDTGKWIYGFLIGFITILVRAVNPAYPEGMMLAVLLLNAFAPTIDHFVVAANIKRRMRRLG